MRDEEEMYWRAALVVLRYDEVSAGCRGDLLALIVGQASGLLDIESDGKKYFLTSRSGKKRKIEDRGMAVEAHWRLAGMPS